MENAPIEGFEYFASPDYREKVGGKGNLLTDKLGATAMENFPRFFRIMASNVFGIFSARKRSFTDITDTMEELAVHGTLERTDGELMKNYPNEELWEDLTKYAWEKWRVTLGFTEVPQELIFREKAILFRYALVAIQEMDREKISKAPKLDAGEEVLAVYNSLGFAVNDIARWLRENAGIRCQSNHPLGGLVSTVPLAAKAGMGWFGRNGLLITPQYGQRQRIAPIFLESAIFPFMDSDRHLWIADYCAVCRCCERACPTGAIYTEGKMEGTFIPGVGLKKSCIEREKCYPYFNRTLGCSICVKICPFSRGGGTYDRLRKITAKRMQ